jgi:protein-serine/threonine kinase
MGKVQKISGCIKFVDVIERENGLGLVMPYYPAGDLGRYIKTVRPKTRVFTESVARILFTQLVKTFQELHKAGIVHRDLKVENVLVEVLDGLGQNDVSVVDKFPEKIKLHLSDFGFAITLDELLRSRKYDSVGTPTYLPYEMLTLTNISGGMVKTVIYDERVDIWCLGVLLYELLYNTTPFMTWPFHKEMTKDRIRQLKYSFPQSPKYPMAEDLIRRILVKPKYRLSLD